jgi:dTDP-4-amino-4,6-dideoxygalactose transaminase
MSSDQIPLAVPSLSGNEARYLSECVETNFVSSVGPFVDRFEREFAAFVGANHAVACASGTAALHVALRVAGVEAGDEVFVPTFTFIASANAVSYQAARPTFVDSEPRTWNADPALIIDELERRHRAGEKMPKALEMVHILGHPADVADVVEACDRFGVAVVEDAAESLGATYVGGPLDGRHVGMVGRLGCFSFNGNKVMTTGGGGMIVTDDEALARRAKHLTTQARLPGLAYDHDEVGYNYRLSSLSAALGVAQLEQLPDFLAAKRRIAARYDAALRHLDGVTLPPNEPWARRSAWLYSITLASPAVAHAVLDELIDAGIGSRPVWPPVHRMAPYATAPLLGSGTVAEEIADATISLPSSVALTEAEQDRVIDVLTAAVRPRAAA